jgi:hypothetical protein
MFRKLPRQQQQLTRSLNSPPLPNLNPSRYLKYVFVLCFVVLVITQLSKYDDTAVRFEDISQIKQQEINIYLPTRKYIVGEHTADKNNHHKQSSSPSSFQLRFDYTNLAPFSDLAKRMNSHQTNCSLSLGNFKYRNRFGLGSDLHIWGQALCNAMQSQVRIRTVLPWTWMDQRECQAHTESSMTCYFPESELNCPQDLQVARAHPTFDEQLFNISSPKGNVKVDCDSIVPNTLNDKRRLRAAGMEYLFGHISPLLKKEAERQLSLVFGSNGAVPSDLITVQMRWGDKSKEMQLVGVQEYVKAVYRILKQRPVGKRDTAHVFLATEDPKAVAQFQKLVPPGWTVYVDQYFHDMLPHRIAEYNGGPKMSKILDGKAGLVALGSLLVAMEANDFVLTTASNWSRLMNELRKNIVDPRCNNCTTMIDLRSDKNEW